MCISLISQWIADHLLLHWFIVFLSVPYLLIHVLLGLQFWLFIFFCLFMAV